MYQNTLVIILLSLLLASCGGEIHKTHDITVEQIEANSDGFNLALDSMYDYNLSLSPTSQAYQGIKDNYGDWGISNDSTSEFYHELTKIQLNFVKDNFNPNKLNAQAQLTHRMYTNDYQDAVDNYEWRYHSYPVNQMFGTHTWIPSFLMNIHDISTEEDARNYLKRLGKVDVKIDELIKALEDRKERGILAPKFVYPYVVTSAQNLIAGYPMDDSGVDNPMLADFRNDLDALPAEAEVSDASKEEMLAEAERLLLEVFTPAYQKLIDYVVEMEKEADDKSGAWKLPEGDAFYAMALERTTTTQYSPQEIFDIGQSEIERIHAEMELIKEEVEFDGDLEAFFTFMEKSEQFYYPNTDEGREGYLQENIDVIDAMRLRLDEIFITKPKAELEVKRVEPFREKSAGIAFYQGPAVDGSRPGTYYANLYDMTHMPRYEIEALSYHEAIPGHHMQISIAQELEGLPKFRTMEAGYTAYSEGWGLYSEFIPKEMGFYSDPYSDFGRLSMELWRACRLVVDVGIHSKQWTREEGIAFYLDNTPAPEGDCIKMVERHIVMPSQATAYKIGQLKILELRNRSKEMLGEKFDIREFHDVVLTNGPVPLNILEELVSEWVNSKY